VRRGALACLIPKHHALLHSALVEAMRLLIIHDSPTDRVRKPRVAKSRKKAQSALFVRRVADTTTLRPRLDEGLLVKVLDEESMRDDPDANVLLREPPESCRSPR
jgi:hypothetical protein